MRPRHWQSVDTYISGESAPGKFVRIVLSVPVQGSPKGTRRRIYHEMTPAETRGFAQRLISMADSVEKEDK